MRFFRSFFILIVAGIACVLLWNHNTNIREVIQSYVENREFLTLEATYSPEQIMEANKNELIQDEGYTFLDPTLKFYPYLLMEVKYTLPNGRTREGVILWSMIDGEMVLDTNTWEKTHGFEDAINAHASRSDFIIMNALGASHRGAMTLSRLQQALEVDQDSLTAMVEGAKKKYLIIQRGDELALHFQDPRFNVPPQTRINQWLVTKPYNHALRVGNRYSRSQIEKIAKAAFGPDFTVRNSKEVFLPVYSIEVLNPDGSVLTSFWNALNGKRVDTKYLTLSP